MLRRLTPLRALVALQLALVAVVGLATVARLPLWSLVDEGAHFDYVEKMAEQGRIPVLGRDLVSDDVQAIADGRYPGRPATDQRRAGLAGQSYEGVQPPLYYVLAAPPSLLVSDHQVRAHLLRGLNLVLLFGTILLVWRLCVAVCGRRDALPAFAVALAFVLWPGVVVRAVTVSNAGLELLTTTAALLALWLAVARRDGRALLAGGALIGCAFLTKPTLIYLAPVLAGAALWLALGPREGRPSRWVAAAAVVLPAVVLLPWFLFSLQHYDALTSLDAGRALQSRYLPQSIQDFTLGDLPAQNAVLLRGILPEEWWRAFLDAPARWLGGGLAMAVLIGVPLALGAWLPRGLRGRAYGLLVAPLVLGLVMINVTMLAGDWDTAGPRYLYPVLPAFAVFAALAVGRRLPRWAALGWVAGGLTAGMAAVWAYMAVTTPYTP